MRSDPAGRIARRGGELIVRSKQAALLVPLVSRTIEPFAVWAGAALAAAVVGNQLRYPPNAGEMTSALRLAMLFLASVVAFALEDPGGATTESVPSPRRFRRSLRIAVLATPVAATWIALAVVAVVRGPGVPVAALTLEMVTLCVTALAIAGLARGRGHARVGGAPFPILLAFHLMGGYIPHRWTLLAGAPGDPVWADAHKHWAVVLVLVTALFLRTMQDPATAKRTIGWARYDR